MVLDLDQSRSHLDVEDDVRAPGGIADLGLGVEEGVPSPEDPEVGAAAGLDHGAGSPRAVGARERGAGLETAIDGDRRVTVGKAVGRRMLVHPYAGRPQVRIDEENRRDEGGETQKIL